MSNELLRMLDGFLAQRDNVEVRRNVCVALAEIDDERADQRLFDLAVSVDEPEAVREAAVAELLSLGPQRRGRVLALLNAAAVRGAGTAALGSLLEGMLRGPHRSDTLRVFGIATRWRVAWAAGKPADTKAWLTAGWPGVLAAALLAGALAWMLSVVVPALAQVDLRQGASDWIAGSACLAALWHALAGRRRVLVGAQPFPLTGLALEMLWSAAAGAVAMALFLILLPQLVGESDRVLSDLGDTAPLVPTSSAALLLLGLAAVMSALGRGVTALGAVRWNSPFDKGASPWVMAAGATLGLAWGFIALFIWWMASSKGSHSAYTAPVHVTLLLMLPAVTAIAVLAALAEAGGETKIHPAGTGTAVLGVGAAALMLVAGVSVKMGVDAVMVAPRSAKESPINVGNLPYHLSPPMPMSLKDLPWKFKFAVPEAVLLKVVLTAPEQPDLVVVVDPRGTTGSSGELAEFDDPESGCTSLKPGEHTLVVRRFDDGSQAASSLSALAKQLFSKVEGSASSGKPEAASNELELQLSMAAPAELKSDPVCNKSRLSSTSGDYSVDADADTPLGRVERGAIVTLTKPAKTDEGPHWTPRMDDLLGRNLVVESVNAKATPPRFRVENESWQFDVRWIGKLTPPARAASAPTAAVTSTRSAASR